MNKPTPKCRVVAPIQARMGSSRLPGKVIMPLGDIPMISLLITRLKQAKSIDEVLLATSANAADDILVKIAIEAGIRVFRGSEEDVLDRLLKATQYADGDIVVDVTGDNPLIDPWLIDEAVGRYRDDNCDYLHTDLNRQFPLGYLCQVYHVDVLEQAHAETEAETPYREHPNLFAFRNPTRFKPGTIDTPVHLQRPNYRVTVDVPLDFELVDKIFQGVLRDDPCKPFSEIVTFLDANPAIATLNRDVKQNVPEC